ncbi:MAG: hypothetical protein ACRENS_05105 [Candidatus Eiseniibacteriota bacterium]
MTPHRSFASSADLSAHVPAHSGARIDRVDAAIQSLLAEARRLERLGLRHALIDCRRQLRYWQFLKALFTLEPAARPSRGTR